MRHAVPSPRFGVAAAALLALVVAGCSPRTARPAAEVAAPRPSATDFAARVLVMHNAIRAQVGVPPLRWSARLEDDAGRWARYLAATRRFHHDPDGDEGENLWMGTRGAFRLETMVGDWASERRVFRPGRFPENSRTGNWEDVGHYTQMVWRGTREVGCALARNARDDYLVCRYYAPGNIDEQRPF